MNIKIYFSFYEMEIIDIVISNFNIDDDDYEKYICCVHHYGDTTSCGGDITASKLKCRCGEAICLSCEKRSLHLNIEKFCTFCNRNLSEQFTNRAER